MVSHDLAKECSTGTVGAAQTSKQCGLYPSPQDCPAPQLSLASFHMRTLFPGRKDAAWQYKSIRPHHASSSLIIGNHPSSGIARIQGIEMKQGCRHPPGKGETHEVIALLNFCLEGCTVPAPSLPLTRPPVAAPPGASSNGFADGMYDDRGIVDWDIPPMSGLD